MCLAGLYNGEVPVEGQSIVGGFILITGIDGTRYAVRQQARHRGSRL
jgi:hypothetical protein